MQPVLLEARRVRRAAHELFEVVEGRDLPRVAQLRLGELVQLKGAGDGVLIRGVLVKV